MEKISNFGLLINCISYPQFPLYNALSFFLMLSNEINQITRYTYESIQFTLLHRLKVHFLIDLKKMSVVNPQPLQDFFFFFLCFFVSHSPFYSLHGKRVWLNNLKGLELVILLRSSLEVGVVIVLHHTQLLCLFKRYFILLHVVVHSCSSKTKAGGSQVSRSVWTTQQDPVPNVDAGIAQCSLGSIPSTPPKKAFCLLQQASWILLNSCFLG